MFHYLLTPLNKHYDYGFGATADSFMDAAKLLANTTPREQGLNQHLPVRFLYRHATERYLKSGIIIFHRKFKLNFGGLSHDGEPKVRVKNRWKQMYSIHSIGALYEYLALPSRATPRLS